MTQTAASNVHLGNQAMADADRHPDPDAQPEQLLAQYISGNDLAFAALVERYESKLYAFINRMTGDGHLAEDVFQQVFIKVAKNAGAFDGRASFSTWLYSIARNTALDELRRRAKRPIEPGFNPGEFGHVADPDAVSPLDKLTREELAEEMRAAILTLPEAQREAFLLKEEADLDFGEIGAILGCGRETAKSRFRLAVGKLRARMGL